METQINGQVAQDFKRIGYNANELQRHNKAFGLVDTKSTEYEIEWVCNVYARDNDVRKRVKSLVLSRSREHEGVGVGVGERSEANQTKFSIPWSLPFGLASTSLVILSARLRIEWKNWRENCGLWTVCRKSKSTSTRKGQDTITYSWNSRLSSN